MTMVRFILILSLSLSAAPVLAQESSVPVKGSTNGMSARDYQIQREAILKRMKTASPHQSQQAPEIQQAAGQDGNTKGEAAHDSTYGQGYGSRKDAKTDAESKQAIEGSRPERPRIERPEHPHFDRPGRP